MTTSEMDTATLPVTRTVLGAHFEEHVTDPGFDPERLYVPRTVTMPCRRELQLEAHRASRRRFRISVASLTALGSVFAASALMVLTAR